MRKSVIALAASVAITFGSCSSDSRTADSEALSSQDSPSEGGQTSPRFDGSRAQSFASTRELASESTLVVKATFDPNRSSVEPVRGLAIADGADPASVPSHLVSAFRVSEVVAGEAPTETIVVRAMAGTDFPEYREGVTYLLYLDDFEWTPGEATGEFVPVGAFAGVFEVVGDDARRLDDASAELPETVRLRDAEAEARTVFAGR